jgi:hypothetical protein
LRAGRTGVTLRPVEAADDVDVAPGMRQCARSSSQYRMRSFEEDIHIERPVKHDRVRLFHVNEALVDDRTKVEHVLALDTERLVPLLQPSISSLLLEFLNNLRQLCQRRRHFRRTLA